MLKKGVYKEMSDSSLRDAFEWPFKVLHDVFKNPAFVPDSEFAPFDLNALRGQDAERSSYSSHRSEWVRRSREKLTIPVWFLVLTLTVIALIVFG